MGGIGAVGRGAARRAPMHVLLPALLAVLAFAAALGMPATAPPPQAWAQEHAETRHGRLAVEEAVYILERHTPVTVRISGQIFAESDERRQVDVVVTLPDSSRSEQSALATRGGHFAVPYQLDKPFPIGADSRPGRYKVSASHGGASLGTVYFEVVRPPQVPAAAAPAREGAAPASGPADAAGGVSALSASVSRPIYSPDAAVTVHGTAEGAVAGVRLRIDVAGPSAGVVYSGVLTTSIAGTYSATIMPPDGRWGGDGEYTAVVTGAGQLARVPFWVESGDAGGGAAMRAPEREVEAAPSEDRRQAEGPAASAPASPAAAAPGGEPGPPDAALQESEEAERGASSGSAHPPREEAAGGQAHPSTGLDTAVLLAAAVAVAAVVAVAVAVAVRRASGSKGSRPVEDKRPAARRPVARRPAAPGAGAVPVPPAGAPAGAASSRRRPKPPAAPPRGAARGGMRVVLDTSVVLNHKKRSKGELENPGFYGPHLDYVDLRRDDLLLPERDSVWQGTKEYADATLRAFETVYGYEGYEKAIDDLRGQLVDDPLSDESIRWIDRKFRWADPERAGDAEGARIGAILDKMGMPRKEEVDGTKGRRTSWGAIAGHGGDGGEEDLKELLRHLRSAADKDQQILAIAMKESEERASILLANDYDFFAFPIWREGIDKSECGPVTMVLGPADARWIVSMLDGSARVLDKKAAVKELYSDEDYTEVLRALQYSKAKS